MHATTVHRAWPMEDTPPLVRIVWDGARCLVWDARHAYALRCAYRIMGCPVGALPTNKRQTSEMGMPLALLFEEALLATEQGFAEVLDGSGLDAVATGHDARPAPNGDAPSAFCSANAAVTESTPSSAGSAPAAAAERPQAGFVEIATECSAWSAAPLARLEATQLRLTGAAQGRLLHAQVYRALWDRGLFITPGACFGADYLCYPGDPMRHHAHMLVHIARPGRVPRGVELACAARLAGTVKKTAVLAECVGSAEVRFARIEIPVSGAVADAAVAEAAGVSSIIRAPIAAAGGPSKNSRRRTRATWQASERAACPGGDACGGAGEGGCDVGAGDAMSST